MSKNTTDKTSQIHPSLTNETIDRVYSAKGRRPLGEVVEEALLDWIKKKEQKPASTESITDIFITTEKEGLAKSKAIIDGSAMYHKLDTATEVFFYEAEFYPFSNFSSFEIEWAGLLFKTSEAAYQWSKFHSSPDVQRVIIEASSAHEAFKLAEKYKAKRDPGWDDRKLEVMYNVLKAKVAQHEYVRHKLLESGDRLLIENSWRDSFWGWGADRQGENHLGRLWMRIRSELRAIK